MRVLANRDIKKLFLLIVLCMSVAALASALPLVLESRGIMAGVEPRNVTRVSLLSAPLCAMIMGGAVLMFCYRYFRQRDRQMEEAVIQIQAFISGDKDARIDCD